VFELKEGTTADIFNSRKTFNFGRTDGRFSLALVDTPDGLQGYKNKLSLKLILTGLLRKPLDSPFINWMGCINLDDMLLENDSDFIKFPTHENFPVKDYTMNTITNEFGSALYITGGKMYSKTDNNYSDRYLNRYLDSYKYSYFNNYIDSNSFYKYNFASKKWVDMTHSANGKLKPLSEHKSVVIDNRYLVILGGKRKVVYNSTSNYSDPDRQETEYDSLYNLAIFDTYSSTWENSNIKADIFDTHISTLQFESFMAAAHKNKIFVLSSYAGENGSSIFSYNVYLGILDLETKSWTWNRMLNEDGSFNATNAVYGKFIVFNDQLIICTSN
jgi:hypothetical protein